MPGASSIFLPLWFAAFILVSFTLIGIIRDFTSYNFPKQPESSSYTTMPPPPPPPTSSPDDPPPSAFEPLWHAPRSSWITSLEHIRTDTGTHGFIFDTSNTPTGVAYSTHNHANMPHIRAAEYPVAPAGHRLTYVELIHRHHKRTPYTHNLYPSEDTSLWTALCSTHPDAPACAFPQITLAGLADCRTHGADLASVYRDLLSFLPARPTPGDGTLRFRITHNPITAQVARQVIAGMLYNSSSPLPASSALPTPSAPPQQPSDGPESWPLHRAPKSTDSLEPQYACPHAAALRRSFGVWSEHREWQRHMRPLLEACASLDPVTGVPYTDLEWHEWSDHYFDSLSARLAHQLPLPCNAASGECAPLDDVHKILRVGQWEYSWIYRGAGPEALEACVASYGRWVLEVKEHLLQKVRGEDGPIYTHNVAHDGSLAMLLGVLQVETMVWPGMGAEVAFELYEGEGRGRRHGGKEHDSVEGEIVERDGLEGWFLRILWSGQIFRSSAPALQAQDESGMLPLRRFVEYVDSLLPRGQDSVDELCAKSQDIG